MKPQSLLVFGNARRFTLAFGAVAMLLFFSCKSTEVEAVPESNQTTKEEKQEEPVEQTPVQNEAKPSVDHSAENAKLIEEIEKARKEAIDAGAEKYYPELLASTDESFANVKKSVDESPSEDHSAELKDILDKYRSLAMASKAQELKEKVSTLDESDLDLKAQKISEGALYEYSELGSNNGSGSDLLSKANNAYNSYNSLLTKGLMAKAGRERKSALSAKKDADSVKAAVAKKTKEQYKSAADTFKNADTAYARKKLEEAYDGYKSSKEVFAELYEIVKKDREEAQARLEAAKARVAASANVAADADGTAPLKEKISGIEDESTELLEKDSFANPNDAVIDLESGEVAQEASEMAENAIAEDEALKNAESAPLGEEEIKDDDVVEEEFNPIIDAK